ncbi:MAG: 3',5'-nucleoside bisphosphate phosphatase [Burkholderiaceae bacterium]
MADPASDTGSADPWRLNVDLHSHSRFSDGTLEPADLVARAHQNGVQVLALTDHDETGGLASAAQVASELGVTFIPGVEISVTWGHTTIHIVGLRIDPGTALLRDGLAAIRAGRDARARAMSDSLAQAGIPDAYEGALQYVGNPQLVSRTHFARFLVETGRCESIGAVFQRYLVEGKPGFVAHRWASLSEAVGWIRAAGGIAVIAHPGRYRLGDIGLWALLEEFREAGGLAIEVITGSHTRDQYSRFARLALEFGFRASRGSDFHGPGESRVDLGELPLLPDSVEPLWHDWAEVMA